MSINNPLVVHWIIKRFIWEPQQIVNSSSVVHLFMMLALFIIIQTQRCYHYEMLGTISTLPRFFYKVFLVSVSQELSY